MNDNPGRAPLGGAICGKVQKIQNRYALVGPGRSNLLFDFFIISLFPQITYINALYTRSIYTAPLNYKKTTRGGHRWVGQYVGWSREYKTGMPWSARAVQIFYLNL